MEVNELMIGDWVNGWDGRWHPVRVSTISSYPEHRPTIVACGGYGYSLVDQVQPIPLTPEILGKNGFHIIQKDWMRLLIDEDTYVSIFIHDKFNLKISKCIYKQVDENGEVYKDFDKVGWHIQYVHELQHALRLAGINKEIVL